MRLSGVADLPLHQGHVPPWLAKIMRRLAKAIVRIAIDELGAEGFLRRISNPLWFQAFNNVIGMDWDSSGSTTVTTAILKEVLNELDVGVVVAGGKGSKARVVPKEVAVLGERLGMPSQRAGELINVSIICAKVDNALIQDGFALYHHTIFFDKHGKWVVVQQGMNAVKRLARRYHLAWYVGGSEVVEEPHSGVASDVVTEPLNLSSRESRRVRMVIIDLINDGVKAIERSITQVNAILKGIKPLVETGMPRHVKNIPYYRPVRLSLRLLNALNQAYEVKPSNFKELLLNTHVGPEGLRALSLVSELIYREPPSLNDVVTAPYNPFKYAYAIGGKDGIPFPVKRKLAETLIAELEGIIERSELGDKDKLRVFRSLRALAPRDVT